MVGSFRFSINFDPFLTAFYSHKVTRNNEHLLLSHFSVVDSQSELFLADMLLTHAFSSLKYPKYYLVAFQGTVIMSFAESVL